MRCDCKIQCPKCCEIFMVGVDTADPKIVQDQYPTKCPKCGKKIKVRLDTPTKPADKPSSDASALEVEEVDDGEEVEPEPHLKSSQTILDSRLRPLLGPHKTGADSATEPGTAWGPPRPDQTLSTKDAKRDKKGKKAKKGPRTPGIFREPDKRLKLAMVLLIIVFILGLINGINSFFYGSNDYIESDVDKPSSVDLHGRIIDFNNGRPIENCRVRIKETGQWVMTDSDGHYFLPNVEVGEHEISAEVSGFTNIIKKVTVDPELMGNINFELKPGAGVNTIDESVEIGGPQENSGTVFSIMAIFFASLGLLAAILIRQRNLFYICSISAFLSILSFGFVLGAFFALFALILILVSRSEFTKPDELPVKPKPKKKRF